jgi:anaerobic magnesium-protoporphyrin IX monomethyl ester cyclase
VRIALLNPPYPYKVVREGRCQHETAIWDSVFPPLSLATLAALLRDEHEVIVLDSIAEQKSESAVLVQLEAFGPELVVASISTPMIANDLNFMKQVKNRTGARTAIFGVHATYFARELAQEPYLDYIFQGEPEFATLHLASRARGSVPGAVYIENDRFVSVPPLKNKRLSFRVPAWDLVDMRRYKIPIKNKSYVLVSTARGCPFNCSFCVVPFYYGRNVRYREVNEVIEELRAVSRYVNEVFFHSDLFTFRKDYVLQLCEAMIRGNLRLNWICNSRVDTFDKEMADVMRRSGCWMVSFGIESGSQKMLNLCAKKITLEQSRQAVSIAKQSGLVSVGHFVLGFPGETIETLRKTLRFSRQINPDFAEFYIATPFPGSQLYEDMKSVLGKDWRNIRYDFDPYNYPFDLASTRHRAYLHFYLRPIKMLRYIRLFGVEKILNMGLSAARFLYSLLVRK